MTGSNRVRAIIFDVDGLLLDTESAIAAVTKDILQSYNVKYDPTFLEPLGRPPRDAVQLLIDYYKLPHSVDDYLAMSGPILEEKYPQCRAMFGARRLVEHLHGHNIPSAFATSSTRRSLTFKTEHHKEWFSLIMGGVTCDDVDVGRGKPAPDLFFKAAELLKQTIKKRGEEDLQYHEILVFEDSPNGIEAAKAAGKYTRPFHLRELYCAFETHNSCLKIFIVNCISPLSNSLQVCFQSPYPLTLLVEWEKKERREMNSFSWDALL